MTAIGQPIFDQQASLDPQRVEADVVEHERIATAVEGGDQELAELYTRNHIAMALARFVGSDGTPA